MNSSGDKIITLAREFLFKNKSFTMERIQTAYIKCYTEEEWGNAKDSNNKPIKRVYFAWSELNIGNYENKISIQFDLTESDNVIKKNIAKLNLLHDCLRDYEENILLNDKFKKFENQELCWETLINERLFLDTDKTNTDFIHYYVRRSYSKSNKDDTYGLDCDLYIGDDNNSVCLNFYFDFDNKKLIPEYIKGITLIRETINKLKSNIDITHKKYKENELMIKTRLKSKSKVKK